MYKEKYQKLFIRFIGNLRRKRPTLKKKFTGILSFFYFIFSLFIEVVGDATLSLFQKRKTSGPVNNPKKILIVKIDQYGDVLFSTFLLPIIKSKYPDIEIDYLINKKTHPVLKSNPQIHEIYFWSDLLLRFFILGRKGDKQGESLVAILKNNLSLINKLRMNNYDYIINTRAFMPSSNFAWWLMKAKNLVAFDISQKSFLAKSVVPYELEEEDWKNYLKLLEPLGIESGKKAFCPSFFNFAKFEPSFNEYIAIAPITFDIDRCWEAEKWRELCGFLTGRGFGVYLTGLESQKEYLEKIKNKNQRIKIEFVEIGELASLIKKSKLFIGIDTFTAHLAIALKKEVICLINTNAYFVKGMSRQKFVGSKAMIPEIENVKIFDTKISSEELIGYLKSDKKFGKSFDSVTIMANNKEK